MKVITRVLREQPDARGLSVAGMPLGSPGMEVPGEKAEAYKASLLKNDGQVINLKRHFTISCHLKLVNVLTFQVQEGLHEQYTLKYP